MLEGSWISVKSVNVQVCVFETGTHVKFEANLMGKFDRVNTPQVTIIIT